MERRLRLLAEQGVRIDQYNKKIRKLQEEPLNLFDDEDAPTTTVEELSPLPYILILIDELADLMMLEGRNVEEAVTRLAQMARAVGMHLVLATQRPSVDVITGLIKANFPARISFRVATRVDSRTILDVMGSEHLLGKGDMLFLPPGSSRLTRVPELSLPKARSTRWWISGRSRPRPSTISRCCWRRLLTMRARRRRMAQVPGAGSDVRRRASRGAGNGQGAHPPCSAACGWDTAARRLLDMMHRDGIVGPPDGSKPREVLKRPGGCRSRNRVR
jgi:S-DNA-T family DNA segregation ATPase FtsK/SpoIIIE